MSSHWLPNLWLTILLILIMAGASIAEPVHTSTSTLLRDAREAIQEEDYEDALLLAGRLIDHDPDKVEGYRLRAAAHDGLGNYEKALADFAAAIKLSPKSFDLLEMRGDAHYRAGWFKYAIADYEAYEAASGYKLTWNRGVALFLSGEYDKAAVLFEVRAKDGPVPMDSFCLRFLCHMRKHGVDDARMQRFALPDRIPEWGKLVKEVYDGRMSNDEAIRRIAPWKALTDGDSRLKTMGDYNVGAAHLFLALYFDAAGKADLAKPHARKAFDLRRDMGGLADFTRVAAWSIAGLPQVFATNPPARPAPRYVPQERTRRIVVVIDASGSTADIFPFMLMEVRRFIASLSVGTDRYAVVMFQNGGVVEQPEAGLLSPRPSNKERTRDWLSESDIAAEGSSDPRAALKRAFEFKPHLVIVVSDGLAGQGRFELNQKALREGIQKLNVGKVRINCVQFPLRDQPSPNEESTRTLEYIATDTGGTFKYVSARELHLAE